MRVRELLGARGVLDARPFERLALGAESVAPPRHLPTPSLESASFASALAISLALRDIACRRSLDAARRRSWARPAKSASLASSSAIAHRLLGRFLASGSLRPPRATAVPFGREPRGLFGHLALLASGLLLTLPRAREAILGPLDRRLFGANGVVGREARVLRRLERLFGRVHVEPRRLELRIARVELGADLLTRPP